MSERPVGYLQPYAVTSALLASLYRTDLILLVVLLTYCFYPSACNTAVETFAEKLIAPFWHGVRKRRPALATSPYDEILNFSQLSCDTPQHEKHRRPCRSMQISHNRAPPRLPSYSTY